MSSLQDLCAGRLMGYISSWERHDYELEKIQDARVNAKHALEMVRFCRTETGEEARRAEAVWIRRARAWRKFANALACRCKTSKERGAA